MDTKIRSKNNATIPREKSLCKVNRLQSHQTNLNIDSQLASSYTEDNSNKRRYDEEILQTLQAINVQLTSLQERPKYQVVEQKNKMQEENESQNSCGQTDGLHLTRNLAQLFRSLLHNQQNQSGQFSPERTDAANNIEISKLTELQSENSCRLEDSPNQSNSISSVHLSSQELAQAQYELANELDASMQKLRQVISESEKIADRINRLLSARENTKQ